MGKRSTKSCMIERSEFIRKKSSRNECDSEKETEDESRSGKVRDERSERKKG